MTCPTRTHLAPRSMPTRRMLAAAIVALLPLAAGADASRWEPRGMVHASIDLAPGESVRTRVFDADGERPELSSVLRITSAEQGERRVWPRLLAARINAERTVLRAGTPGADGVIAPADGDNRIYADAASSVRRVEVQVDKAPTPDAGGLQVSGLRALAGAGGPEIELGVSAIGNYDVTVTVLDASGSTRGSAGMRLDQGGRTLRVPLAAGSEGVQQVVVKAIVSGSEALIQKTYTVQLPAAMPQR